jgi:hypothetical protein
LAIASERAPVVVYRPMPAQAELGIANLGAGGLARTYALPQAHW